MAQLLILEPFYGGSHKQLLDTLTSRLDHDSSAAPLTYHLVTLPAKKWHWRARTSALKLSQMVERDHEYTTLLTSSVTSLAELLGLRPDLAQLRKIVYFHENQLCYPVQKAKDRDFQYGYNQITSSLAADTVLFNSAYNLTSFLDNIPKFLSLQPDQRADTRAIVETIRHKSQVAYFPLQLPDKVIPKAKEGPVHIVWPHRWEHDKDPDMLCRVVLKLHEAGHQFVLSMLGEVYSEVPEIITTMKQTLQDKIAVFGFLPSRESYFQLLSQADVVVSTAKHEFYGVSMLEAAWLGCYPLCPNSLVYPEIYPPECLYNTEQQLFKLLANFCKNPKLAREGTDVNIDFEKVAGERALVNLVNLLKL